MEELHFQSCSSPPLSAPSPLPKPRERLKSPSSKAPGSRPAFDRLTGQPHCIGTRGIPRTLLWSARSGKFRMTNIPKKTNIGPKDSETQTGETTEDVAPTPREELVHTLPLLEHRSLSQVPFFSPRPQLSPPGVRGFNREGGGALLCSPIQSKHLALKKSKPSLASYTEHHTHGFLF